MQKKEVLITPLKKKFAKMPYILHFVSESNVSEIQPNRASGGSRCYTQPCKPHQEPEVSSASI